MTYVILSSLHSSRNVVAVFVPSHMLRAVGSAVASTGSSFQQIAHHWNLMMLIAGAQNSTYAHELALRYIYMQFPTLSGNMSGKHG